MELELITKRCLDSAIQEIILLDTELNIMEINSACLQVIGLSREAAIDQPLSNIWDAQSIRKLKEDWNRKTIRRSGANMRTRRMVMASPPVE